MGTNECYLYGAAVQGIQGFIFQTNNMKDIVGASELVECICTKLFAEHVGYNGDSETLLQSLKSDSNAIVNAAGNIKYLFTSREACEKMVREFPKAVVEFAPGITISQAVEKMDKDFSKEDFRQAVLKLEAKLRLQRNKPMRSTQPGFMGVERSRQTGLPVIDRRRKDNTPLLLDAATYRKLYTEKQGQRIERKDSTQLLCNKAFGNCENKQIPFNIGDVTSKNDWIAVIHVDGNGLGQVVQHIGSEMGRLKEFSFLLDQATTQAAKEAFGNIMRKPENASLGKIPFRPIVLSGDDHTMICRADLAIPYTMEFIRLFEKYTQKMLGDFLKGVFKNKETKLSACAGIAFIKSSFPFYYAYELAESLCGHAKKDTKELYRFTEGNLPASCLMFHKVQDSFFVDYKDIIDRELTPGSGHSFKFGPYYMGGDFSKAATDAGRWTCEQLIRNAKQLGEEAMGPVQSGLRNWMSLIYTEPGQARQKRERLLMIASEAGKELIEEICPKESPYPVYDLLTLITINNQETRTL